jgi:stage II sporulation protein R
MMKRFFFLLFTLIVAVMSWEGQLTAANLVDSGPIPQESIRLRIIANSDSFQDQWLKREVRDAIVAQMNTWVTEIGSYEEAKRLVAQKVPELQQLVDRTIIDRGFSYRATVDFGQVSFPTKLYGSYVYPAGNYQALRVRIGEAKGQNWWCVLFPPLCFIDMSNGDAVDKNAQPVENTERSLTEAADSGLADLAEEREYRLNLGSDDYAAANHAAAETVESGLIEDQPSIMEASAFGEAAAEDEAAQVAEPKMEIRFYLWDKLVSLF